MSFIASNDPDRQEIWSRVGPLTNTTNKQRVLWFHHKSKTGAFCTPASNHSLSSGEKTGNAPAQFSLGEISQQTLFWQQWKPHSPITVIIKSISWKVCSKLSPTGPGARYIWVLEGTEEQQSGLLNTSQLTFSQTRDRAVLGQLSTRIASAGRNMGISAHPNTSLNSGF